MPILCEIGPSLSSTAYWHLLHSYLLLFRKPRHGEKTAAMHPRAWRMDSRMYRKIYQSPRGNFCCIGIVLQPLLWGVSFILPQFIFAEPFCVHGPLRGTVAQDQTRHIKTTQAKTKTSKKNFACTGGLITRTFPFVRPLKSDKQHQDLISLIWPCKTAESAS